LRYHGHAIPENIECDPNILSVWWENIVPKPGTDCPFPVATLNAKYAACWKQADVSAKTMKIYYDQNDDDAARLAWIAECVTRRLLSLVCANPAQVDVNEWPLDHEFLQMANKPQFLGATPTGAQGGVAGITWRVQVGLIDRVPVS